jgi:hypothetical protein
MFEWKAKPDTSTINILYDLRDNFPIGANDIKLKHYGRGDQTEYQRAYIFATSSEYTIEQIRHMKPMRTHNASPARLN